MSDSSLMDQSSFSELLKLERDVNGDKPRELCPSICIATQPPHQAAASAAWKHGATQQRHQPSFTRSVLTYLLDFFSAVTPGWADQAHKTDPLGIPGVGFQQARCPTNGDRAQNRTQIPTRKNLILAILQIRLPPFIGLLHGIPWKLSMVNLPWKFHGSLDFPWNSTCQNMKIPWKLQEFHVEYSVECSMEHDGFPWSFHVFARVELHGKIFPWKFHKAFHMKSHGVSVENVFDGNSTWTKTYENENISKIHGDPSCTIV